MNLRLDAVLSKIPNFMNLRLSSIHTSDEVGFVFIPTTRIGRLTGGSDWLLPGHWIGEVTADRVIRAGSEQNCNAKTDFETRREIQYFGRQNISMSLPPLDSTPLGANTTNGTTSPIDLIPIGTKTPEPTELTRPTDFSGQDRKALVPGDLDPDSSSSDSSSNKSNSSKDSNSIKLIKKEINKKKKRQKHKKQDV